MAASNDQALGHALYWDEHYSQSDGSTPTHEWYVQFSDLEPFFERNIFASPGLTAKDNPMVLHLGSGDSV